jgi:hypothetical protein
MKWINFILSYSDNCWLTTICCTIVLTETHLLLDFFRFHALASCVTTFVNPAKTSVVHLIWAVENHDILAQSFTHIL